VQPVLDYSACTKKTVGHHLQQKGRRVRVKLSYGRQELLSEFPKKQHVNVTQVLQSVKDSHPDIYQYWCNKEGHLRSSFPIFVNGVHIRYLKGMETELSEGDEMYIIPMLAGG
jgi:molybdopterin converting factor small subunit